MASPSPLDPLDPGIPPRKLDGSSQAADKTLPPPPHTFDHIESAALVLGTTNIAALESSPQVPRPTISSTPSFQRPKKRVIWRNRGIIIALPIDSGFGKKTSRESYLKPEEVARSLDDWKSKGYDTKGFVLAPEAADASILAEGQSRAVHPDPDDERQDRANRSYKVNIPGQREWEAYVNQLKEEKLRALGVSFGDEEPPRKSPAPSLMTRQASSQSSAMLTSPALAPHPGDAMPFPSNLQGPGNAASHVGKPGVAHFPRYSMAMPFGQKPFPSPNQFPQPSQSPVPETYSPQQYLASQPGSRVASPMINGYLQGLDGAISPMSPIIQNSISQTPSQAANEMLARMRQQQALLQHQQQISQQRPLSTNRSVQDQMTKPEALPHSSQPEIASPIPCHRQNASETLQKEVDANQSYQKRSTSQKNKQQGSGANAKSTINEAVSISAKVDASDIHTNSTLVGTPDHQHNGGSVAHIHSSKSSKASNSKLNVNASEFKFEPKKSTGPGVFSSLGNQQPPKVTEDDGAPAIPNLVHSRNTSNGPPQASKLNVAAPAFTPRAAAKSSVPPREFSFAASGSASKPGVPIREFSFSSLLPLFNPDAPTFKPIDSGAAASSDTSNKGSPVEAVKKIFGDIKFHEVIKPAKKSKAVPIIKPDEYSEGFEQTFSETDGQEDESGRITQADGRRKRMRRELDNRNQVPLLASPNQTPWMDHGDHDRAAYFSTTPSPRGDEATVEAATDLLEELIDDLSATEASELMKDDESVVPDGNSFEPHSLHDIDDAANFSTALPPASSRGRASGRLDPTPHEIATATVNFLGKSPQFKGEFDQALERRISGSSVPRTSAGYQYSDRMQQEDGIDRIDHARQDIVHGVRYIEPTYDKMDDIVKHLNQGDSDLGVEREPSPFKHRNLSVSPRRSPMAHFINTSGPHQLLPPSHIRSDAPSPSPNRLNGTYQYLPPTDSASANTSDIEMVIRNARHSPSYRPSITSPPIHRLNSPSSTPPSDWDDAISSLDEEKFRSRTGFFDIHVNDVIGDVVQQRLGPLEKTLSSIQQALVDLSSRSTSRRPRSSGTLEIEHSDADDEDDVAERPSSKMKSPLLDRKYDQLMSSLKDITAAQQTFAPASQLTEVMSAVKDLKASIQQGPQAQASATVPAPAPSSDIKAIVEEAVGKQLRGKSGVVASSSQAAAAEKSQLQIAGLESMLKIAEARAEDEMKARRSTEDALADNQRLLRGAMQEAAEQREAAEATERSLQEYHEERHNVLKRTAMLEGAQENLENMASDLSDKNAALEDTLAEYRLSSDQWRSEINDARHENKDLRRTIDILKTEKEANLQVREALRSNFDRLQEDVSQASQEAALDQTSWRGKEEEHNARLNMLGARLEAEARTRERLEVDIERLEAQENEATKARFMIEQTLKANAQLEGMVIGLKAESHEYQKTAARFEREFNDARETARMENNRTRTSMGADLDTANNQANIVRSDLESVIVRLEKQVESIMADSDKARSRYELMLQEVSNSRHAALREAAEAREAALQEHYRFHEQMLGEMNGQHERALINALQDKQRSETYFGNRLNLADEKVVHYQDKITHLEEKFEIAKSAAHAAVQAVQAKKATASPVSMRGPQPLTKTSGIPEKISPQALRESILVLQEQLQERETHIEQLESELSSVDTNAPAKLKDANIEITWLRELLGVRIDDLEDIITTLSQPAYDREAVKDAAIRLKANLQMEQQEKERALAGGQTFPSLISLSNLAASPRALPLAAAAAWGNWRKGKETGFSNLGAMVNGSAQQTPSKSSPQSFFAGLMTPPSTDIGTTPTFGGGSRLASASSKRAVRGPTTPRQSLSSWNDPRLQQEPVTPPLMRKASYDLDASESIGFGDEGIEGNKVAEDEEPFGPRLGGIVGKI